MAFAVQLSTIWASSRTTRHHLRRVRGVGTISYLHTGVQQGRVSDDSVINSVLLCGEQTRVESK